MIAKLHYRVHEGDELLACGQKTRADNYATNPAQVTCERCYKHRHVQLARARAAKKGERVPAKPFERNGFSYTRSMQPHRFIERHLLHLLVNHMFESGYTLYSFHNGYDEESRVTTFAQLWAQFVEADEGRIYFCHRISERLLWVFVRGGNGAGDDVISDYDATIPDDIMHKVFLY